MFGPTTGDRLRLADTDIVIEVEKDFTTYGDEVKFGGGKVIRDGMGQSPGDAGRGGGRYWSSPTRLVLDVTGVFKADIGVRDGRIVGIGKAGNPDAQTRRRHRHRPGDGSHRRRGQDPHRRRVSTCHIHFICPQQVDDALIVAA
ncbi:MAG: hypothetical protein ACMVO3_07310 [Thalassobaculum sp.]